jgi:hypothetical protein
LTGGQAENLQAAANIDYDGGSVKYAADMVAMSVVGTLCSAPFWLTTTLMLGGLPAGIVGPLMCGAAALLSAIIFDKFNWFRDPTLDNAYWTVNTANVNYADGNSLNIAY